MKMVMIKKIKDFVIIKDIPYIETKIYMCGILVYISRINDKI